MTVSWWIDAEHRTAPVWDVFDRNEVNAPRISTLDRDVVDLTGVGSARISWIAVVSITAASCKDDGPEAKAARLALDSRELL
ncbi:MAG: hypothetical protein ACJ74P_02185, partial [Gaiellaceae bacterium]